MRGAGFLLLLCLSCGGLIFEHVYCQKEKYAPQNVSATADADSIHITWSTPTAVVQSVKLSQYLQTYRVQVFGRSQPEIHQDHWVPRSTGGHLRYGHKVTCLPPGSLFVVSVQAVYRANSNVSQADAVSESMNVTTKEKNWFQGLLEHPIPIVFGAAVTLLVVIIVVPVACYCVHRRRRRRQLRRLNGPISSLDRAHRRKSSSTATLPSAKELRDLEAAANQYYLDPSTASNSSTPRAVPHTPSSSANQRSPLMHYSPPSSYRAASSVPSEVAPSRPPGNLGREDVYELDGSDVYENAEDMVRAHPPHVKSTSFSATPRPLRVPVSINGDHDGGGASEEDGNDGTYENFKFGRRCITGPPKSKSPKVVASGRWNHKF